jgi:hypothetical protein
MPTTKIADFQQLAKKYRAAFAQHSQAGCATLAHAAAHALVFPLTVEPAVWLRDEIGPKLTEIGPFFDFGQGNPNLTKLDRNLKNVGQRSQRITCVSGL